MGFFAAASEAYAIEKGKVARWQGPETKISEAEADETGSGAEQDAPAPSRAETTLKKQPGMPAPKPAAAKDEQRLVVSYVKPDDKDYSDLAAVLQESKGIDEIAAVVNETFNFPHIDVVFDQCGQENAFYDSENRRIILCYELVAALANGFRQDEDLTDEEVGEQVIGSLIFTFFHELGHAAVDVFDIPITGNEEDAVDRFATLLLLSDNESDAEEVDLADSAIGSFDLETAESLEDLDFADEHPVNEQRWYTMACLMVGSNPEKYDYLVGEDGLPPERAEACPTEYAKISKSWNGLMKPHLKKA